MTRGPSPRDDTTGRPVSLVPELLLHPLLQILGARALELRFLVIRIDLEHAVPVLDREIEVLPLEGLRRGAIVALDQIDAGGFELLRIGRVGRLAASGVAQR